MPRVRVRFFAAPREVVGAAVLPFVVPEGATVGDLLERLYRARPELVPWREHVLVAVNRAYVPETEVLGDGDEVAFMPPVSGGEGGSCIQRGPFDVEAVVRALDRSGAGATVFFLGTVRGEDGAVDCLEFEAYEEMADEVLGAIRAEAVRKFGLSDAVVRHRLGTLAVGEDIVLVAVASAHRREAFEAAEWMMNEVKARAPVWKREVGPARGRWVNDPVEEALE